MADRTANIFFTVIYYHFWNLKYKHSHIHFLLYDCLKRDLEMPIHAFVDATQHNQY